MTMSHFTLLARVLFVIALIGATTLAVMPQPPDLPTDQFGDKVNHIIAFSVLAALAAAGWPQASRWRTIERLSFLGALIEVVQSVPVLHRDCDIRDWIADTLAVVVVTALAALVVRARDAATGRGA